MNFQKLVIELTARSPQTGKKLMSYRQISDLTGISISALSRIANGNGEEPRFTPGYNLVKLHAEKVQHAQEG